MLRHLAVKFDFLRLGNISPHFPKTILIFLFLRLHRPQRLHNIELGGGGGWGRGGGIRELTLDANKIEQVCLSIERHVFPKSVSTTNCGDFLYISKL